ncbi:MAG: hypothetical protein MUE97_01950, partial [Phycisphaerales bacterium]|nr:hypothetical protein [Phycisphaerales bacterium]
MTTTIAPVQSPSPRRIVPLVIALLAVLIIGLLPSRAWAGGCLASWVPGIGTQGVSGSNVNAFAVLPGGDVIVGGGFTSAGSLPVNNIARVNPSTGVWSALGVGTNSTVSALAVLPGGDVIVGGAFTS